ncbi:hypothetical protein ACRE_039590 [Hapsidospora chrysogenum ATCC 11550]|uniref:Uncharacterized protein n=1 Tax=Hapsidospora chrysogenum (strain ATCC 11550 / CBS 779.69 / DSM 880 / IAM 14645 / JCM 23072 / IMI 49137) TaxID=857340 RepID=A0A086T7B9_HAPC1|nr:hypothetical protein ACRE_039590 [Hapsidospora chrysogenum ATCC 11550]
MQLMIPGADEELDFFIVFVIPEDIVSERGKTLMASKSPESRNQKQASSMEEAARDASASCKVSNDGIIIL